MLNSSLIELIHKGTLIQRWNDHIRPFTGFTEIDKQAHKIFYAYVLAKSNEDCGGKVDMCNLIEGLIFEYIHRIILTDIKPPIYHKLISQKGAEINKWVIEQTIDELKAIDEAFAQRMISYFTDDEYSKQEKIIIKFAHYLATRWEFDIIYPFNKTMYNIENTKTEVTNSLSNCPWFEGKQEIYQNPKILDFVSFIGRLRFQQRWTATARIPQTSVIGHTLVVAFFSYFFSVSKGYCKKRCENNFFGGLFHDLPEVLTRDIISPVKRGIEGLDGLIKDIEVSQLEEIVYPLIPDGWRTDIDYYTDDEFDSKIKLDGQIIKLTSEEISDKYDENKYCPIDGQIIRVCDHISAYLEAYLSVMNGVEAESLMNSMNTLYGLYKDKTLDGVDYGKYFEEFYPHKNQEKL